MNATVSIILIALLGAGAVLVVRELVKSLSNLITLFKDGYKREVINQRNGMVFNKKNNKLEADQSVILPH